MRYTIREHFIQVADNADIMDESGQPVFRVDGQLFSLRDVVIVRDLAGNEVSRFQRKLIALRPTFEITIGGQQVAEIHKHLFTPLGDRFTVKLVSGDDLEIAGNFVDHEYTITREGQAIATVSKQWLTIRETFGVDIADGENDRLLLTAVLAMDLAEDQAREQR